MTDASFAFLKQLLDTPGPSGFETAPARIWREEAAAFADATAVDVNGNSTATLNPEGSPHVMLVGHIDEIGLMITHVDEEGFLYFKGIGGWDAQVLVAQRVRILTRAGDVLGVIGKKPIHLLKPDEKEKATKLTDLWIDIGARDRAAAQERGVRIGDAAVLDARLVELGSGLIASRSVDNRIGAFVVLEALRLLAEGERPGARVTAAATTQEEIGHHGSGAGALAFGLEPQVALVVDVTFATDSPGMEKRELGEHKLGGGPVLARGSASNPRVFERIAGVAEAEGIPFTIQAQPGNSFTDADHIYFSRAGVATGLISIPNRYMHSPNELVALEDLDAAARLIAAFCRSIEADPDFIPG
ncbi:M42 family metallopeptidase [soil metagenome]